MPIELHVGRASRPYLAAGVLICFALPALSWLDGSGQLAWTMFSRTGSYRLKVIARAPDGKSRWIAPTEVAAIAGGATRDALAGAESWRLGETRRATLHREIQAVARLACRVAHDESVELTLEERMDLDAPARMARVVSRCGP